ncbi:MAG TPA: GAF domain-containing protein [Thermoanaerobaculia bacterium]|nr:GAF domain-containing protein [Thermoanaerobaculia bacterium]
MNGTGRAAEAEAGALGELARCETLAQKAAWAARWCARLAGADAALVFAVHAATNGWIALGAFGEGAAKALRRVVPRDSGIAREVVRSRAAKAVRGDDAAVISDPLLSALPAGSGAILVAPFLLDKGAAGAVALSFRQSPAHDRLAPLEAFLPAAAAALDRAQLAERKVAGQLFAIERLTNLYDVAKAFGSTIHLGDLSSLIARKAADFAAAEVASFWLFDSEADEVSLAATAVNENYEVPNPPVSVGGALVGTVLADQTVVRNSALASDDPLRHENPSYEIRSVLAAPLFEKDLPVGVIVAVNKRGRVPEFTATDEELLVDVARQAVTALRNARQYEAEKRVQELDALLAVSREITSTLDLDKVMHSIVNATAALIRYDRCAIAVQSRGRLKLGAVSGVLEMDRSRPDLKRTEEILEWVYGTGTDVNVTEADDGTLTADRPETAEKFRVFFRENKLKSFYGIVLKDEEGKLGVLAFESSEALDFDPETRGLLQILVNQATVAVRNAQLYQQVPLVGFWRPLLRKRKEFLAISRGRRTTWVLSAAVLFVVLFLVPWRMRITGAARILPGKRAAVTAGVDGVVASVLKLEGDVVKQGDVIAVLEDERYAAAAAEARSAYQIAVADLARHRDSGNAAAAFEADSRKNELAARIAFEQAQLSGTRLVAPMAGVIVTPRIQERVGQHLATGAELCVVADTGNVIAEVAVPEEEIAFLAAGQSAGVKVNPYPGRTFGGTVTRVGSVVREEDKERYVVADIGIANPDGTLKTGMLGKAKIVAGRSNIALLFLRRPARWLYGKLWPLLP